MSKVAITVDSTVDLPKELVEKYNLTVCPLYVNIGDEFVPDDGRVTNEDVYAFYEKTGKICSSSACNVDDYTRIFSEVKQNADEIVHIGLSSELSSTVNNARIAAEEVGGVYIVDSRNLSSGIALITLKASELAAAGEMTAAEIVAYLEDMIPRVDTSFIISTLEYLHAGGRCSTLAKLGANLLGLKPKIVMRGGKMTVSKKYRGNMAAARIQYALDTLHDPDDIELDRIFITHSCRMDQEELENIIKTVKETLPFKEVIVNTSGIVISAHCGPACYGVLFVRKKPIDVE